METLRAWFSQWLPFVLAIVAIGLLSLVVLNIGFQAAVVWMKVMAITLAVNFGILSAVYYFKSRQKRISVRGPFSCGDLEVTILVTGLPGTAAPEGLEAALNAIQQSVYAALGQTEYTGATQLKSAGEILQELAVLKHTLSARDARIKELETEVSTLREQARDLQDVNERERLSAANTHFMITQHSAELMRQMLARVPGASHDTCGECGKHGLVYESKRVRAGGLAEPCKLCEECRDEANAAIKQAAASEDQDGCHATRGL